MKKVLFSVLLLVFAFVPCKVVFAGSIAPSTTSLTVQQGNSTSFSVIASNAIGDVIVSSSNPSVATVSPGSWATGAIGAGQNLSGAFTVTGVSPGSATITIVIDGYAFDNGGYDVSGTRTINVTVTAPPAPAPSNPTPSTPTPSIPTPSTPAPSGPADTRSTNVNLASLTIDGKEIKYANGSYYLEVGNYVEKVNIAAKAADSKAKVSGTGSKDLKVGENNFNVVVTAERGNTHAYVVKVIRKEFNSLSEVNDILKDKKEAEIRVNKDDKLNKDLIDKIIKEKKKVSLVKMSDDGKTLLYSFILDGSKIKSVNEFNPSIVSDIENNTDMEAALNYAEGIYLDFSKCGDVPKGVIVRYYVGDKYDNDDLVNLYAYDKNVIKQLKENVKVKDGYIEFEVTNSIKHFISKAKVMNAEKVEEFNIWMIVSLVLGVVCLGLLGLLIFSKTKKEEVKEVVPEKKKVETTKHVKHDKDIDDGKTKEFKKEIVEEEPEITEVVEDSEEVL